MFKFGLEFLLQQRQRTAEKLQKEFSGLQLELQREQQKRLTSAFANSNCRPNASVGNDGV